MLPVTLSLSSFFFLTIANRGCPDYCCHGNRGAGPALRDLETSWSKDLYVIGALLLGVHLCDCAYCCMLKMLWYLLYDNKTGLSWDHKSHSLPLQSRINIMEGAWKAKQHSTRVLVHHWFNCKRAVKENIANQRSLCTHNLCPFPLLNTPCTGHINSKVISNPIGFPGSRRFSRDTVNILKVETSGRDSYQVFVLSHFLSDKTTFLYFSLSLSPPASFLSWEQIFHWHSKISAYRDMQTFWDKHQHPHIHRKAEKIYRQENTLQCHTAKTVNHSFKAHTCRHTARLKWEVVVLFLGHWFTASDP